MIAIAINGAWLSLVERSVRDREVVGSNPIAPTFQISNLEAVNMAAFLLIPAPIPAILIVSPIFSRYRTPSLRRPFLRALALMKEAIAEWLWGNFIAESQCLNFQDSQCAEGFDSAEPAR
jgi:hypothetical protein